MERRNMFRLDAKRAGDFNFLKINAAMGFFDLAQSHPDFIFYLSWRQGVESNYVIGLYLNGVRKDKKHPNTPYQ
ncbi:hypothetical protein BLA23254_05349 [Burkholderia lata]|uniref:Uncharacterized protein n=2 Tax=Burkholderia lata (strain ATCC 17760 / DSM 23089 / LMG 22485 / NCIMB 9086 / R18194 / 383) TaxID=482957 RepID=A0A6P2PTD1_BURL3|nr:hypothetical protein BLA23254_05349 [Burkholderia lata]